jgi:HK97 family phage major capsid protein
MLFMNEETKKLLDELKTTWTAEFKAANEELQSEIKKHGEASAESEQKLDKIQGALDDIEVRFQKLAEEASVVNRGEKPKSEQTKSFVQWLRKGDKLDVRQLVEQKVLIESDDSSAGFLAPDEFVGEIIKGIVLYSPIRKIARVRPTSARASKFPKRTGTFAAAWVDELDSRAETTGLKYGLEEIPNHELIAVVDVSQDDLEDSYFNLEAEVTQEAQEQFGVAEGTAFVSGFGMKRPEGFLTNTNINQVHLGDANLLTFDGILSMAASLKDGYVDGGADGYENGATWVMNRKTLYAIRKLKDTTNQYLWTPQFGAALIDQPPALIDGRPYITAPDMPDVASNATPIAFGNFKRAYVISDRVTMSIQRDPYTQAGSGNVRFWFRKRVGGQVVLPEALTLGLVAV